MEPIYFFREWSVRSVRTEERVRNGNRQVDQFKREVYIKLISTLWWFKWGFISFFLLFKRYWESNYSVGPCFSEYFLSDEESKKKLFEGHLVVRSLQTTPRLSASLEGLTGLRLLYSQLWFMTVKGYRSKSAKGKSTWAKSRIKLAQGSWCSLPVESHGDFSQKWCMMIWVKYCKPEKLTWTSVSRYFTGGQSHMHAAPVWLIWVTQSPVL